MGSLIELFDEAQRQLSEERHFLRGAWAELRANHPALTTGLDDAEQRFGRRRRRLDWEAAIVALREAIRSGHQLRRLHCALETLRATRRAREVHLGADHGSPLVDMAQRTALAAETAGTSFLHRGAAGEAIGALAVERHYLSAWSRRATRSDETAEPLPPPLPIAVLNSSLHDSEERARQLLERLRRPPREA